MTHRDLTLKKRPDALCAVIAGAMSMHLTGCVDPLQSVAPPEVRSWMLIAALVLLLGMTLLLLRHRNAPSAATVQRMESTISSLKGQVSAAMQELDVALGRVRTLGEELQTLQATNTAQAQHGVASSSERPPETQASKAATLLYLTTPESDGTFDDQLRSTRYIAGESMYVLTLEPTNQSRARFELIMQRDALDLALRRRERFVEPFCDTVNAYRSSATDVETIEPGTMELSGGSWRVVKKATIKYV